MFVNTEERNKNIAEIAASYLEESKFKSIFSWEDFFEKDLFDKVESFLIDKFKSNSKNVLSMGKNAITNFDVEYLNQLKKEMLKSNNISSKNLEDYADKIEAWHNKEEDGLSLIKFIGLNERQYQILLSRGSVLS